MSQKNFILPIVSAGIVLVACLILMIVLGQSSEAQAARPALENGCVEIGTIGAVKVARCYDDEVGTVFYGNSNGWMTNPIDW